MRKNQLFKKVRNFCIFLGFAAITAPSYASSHREAPLIANDPQADNTDVYAFRSPDDTNTVTIICNYMPFESPDAGPNYYFFSQNVRYEVHIKNKSTTTGDDILYRFTFTRTNQDPTTFFNIRFGQNLATTYTCQKSTDNGVTFTNIVTNGIVPAANIGPRSIISTGLPAGLGLHQPSYYSYMQSTIANGANGEKVFCGPIDDPFFVDLGGAFDLGNFRPTGNTTNAPKDGLARFNVHTIALKIPINQLQQAGQSVTSATSILDPNFVIGVWASSSRQSMRTLATPATNATSVSTVSGPWVQVSRLGMPLTNEVIIPIGMKDLFNASNPSGDVQFAQYFENPELALYMDTTELAKAVPAFNGLRVQTHSLGSFDFRNNAVGLYNLKGNAAVVGTAFDPTTYGPVLLPDNHSPRSVDILPIFFTGVPNLAPYQLVTGKTANSPLTKGKPFINNFLPTLGDMLRLNMAVPVTQRNDPAFSSLGIIQAAVLGITNPIYANINMQFIPNMDGFPNGRRLEDDVTTIEVQAVAGVALAAIGLFYDDYTPNVTASGVTTQLNTVLKFNAGPTANDTTFNSSFPYVQAPWRGFDYTMQARF